MIGSSGWLVEDVSSRPFLAALRWMDEASCLDVPPEIMFSRRPDARQRGRATCAGCPVRIECSEYALDEQIEHGLFGGLDEDERRALLQATEVAA